jgi:small subunit ribosomal protein S14
VVVNKLGRSWNLKTLLNNLQHFHPSTDAQHFTMPKIGVLRDIKARHGVHANEVLRRAYLYVARNQNLSPQVRYQAQLQLNTFGRYTRPTTVKNRCVETGRGRGIMGEFGLCRVSL